MAKLYMTADPFTLTNMETLETTTYNSLKELLDVALKEKSQTFYVYELDKLTEALAHYFFSNKFTFVPTAELEKVSSALEKSGTFTIVGSYEMNDTVLLKARRTQNIQGVFYNAKKIFGGVKVEKVIKAIGADNEIEGVVFALTDLLDRGMNGWTLSGNAFKDFKYTIWGKEKNGKKTFFESDMEKDYPKQTQEDHDLTMETYQGGICFAKPEMIGHVINKKGYSFDVNSMYPAIMRDEFLPTGQGIRFEGKYEYDRQYDCFLQKMTIGKLTLKKDGAVPTIRKRKVRGKTQLGYYTDEENLTLTLWDIDIEMMYDNYDVEDVTYHGGLKFMAVKGVPAPYVNKWNDAKIEATKSKDDFGRFTAKLMLNSVYGKLASKTDRKTWKLLPATEDAEIRRGKHFSRKKRTEGTATYAPAGSYISALARKKLVKAIKDNWDNFVYSDTDSIYILGEDVKGIELDETKLGAWKKEYEFSKMYIVGKKQYVIADENGKVVKTACAGMPDETADEQIKTIEDFKLGAIFNCKISGYDKYGYKTEEIIPYELKDEQIY